MVSEGSGGHLVPALEVARELARSSSVRLVFPQRPQTGQFLADLLTQAQRDGVELQPLRLSMPTHPVGRRLQQARTAFGLWAEARGWLAQFHPSIVVGFGGWVSIPVVVAARARRIPILIHEQNAQLGKANRLLTRWADRVALSFPQSQAPGARGETKKTMAQTFSSHRGPVVTVTGLPVRSQIGRTSRDEAARQLGLDPCRFTIAVLGGSQGSRALNQLVGGMLQDVTDEERRGWQIIHVTGPSVDGELAQAYATARVPARVVPHLAQIDQAYALTDLVIARAGASTLAELAQSGRPAILVPYPYAGAHQRANARVAQRRGAALMLEEQDATSAQLLGLVRWLRADPQRRHSMGEEMSALSSPGAVGRLVKEIRRMAGVAAEVSA